MVDACTRIIKYLLFAFNFLILLAGLTILGVGIWGLTENTSMERLLGVSLFNTMGIILVVGGIVIAVVSFLGCCGASKEKRAMLCLFATILIAVFIAVLACGILAYVYWSQVESQLKQEMLKTVEQYKQDDAITQAWDTVQQLFQCCGISENAQASQNVWKRNSNFQTASAKVPTSCCKSQDSTAVSQCQSDPATNAYSQDCYFAVKEFLQKHSHIFGGVAIGFVCVLFFNILFSCILFAKIRRTEHVYVHNESQK